MAGGRLRRIPFALRGLNLSPEQRQQMRAVFKAHRPEIQALRQRVAEARKAQPGTPLSPEVRKGFAQQRQQIMQGVRKETMAVLTPEQQQRLEARRARRAQRR